MRVVNSNLNGNLRYVVLSTFSKRMNLHQKIRQSRLLQRRLLPSQRLFLQPNQLGAPSLNVPKGNQQGRSPRRSMQLRHQNLPSLKHQSLKALRGPSGDVCVFKLTTSKWKIHCNLLQQILSCDLALLSILHQLPQLQCRTILPRVLVSSVFLNLPLFSLTSVNINIECRTVHTSSEMKEINGRSERISLNLYKLSPIHNWRNCRSVKTNMMIPRRVIYFSLSQYHFPSLLRSYDDDDCFIETTFLFFFSFLLLIV